MTLPIKVDSNSTGLAYAEETALKVLTGAPTFYAQEPNTYNEFGSKLTLVAREIINPSRQKLKGTITDLDANAGWTQDVTQNNLTRLLQGFFFAGMRQQPGTRNYSATPGTPTASEVAVSSVAVSGGITTFTFASAVAGIGVANRILFLKNFAGVLNTGMVVASGGSSTTATVASSLTVEASPPATAEVKVVGYQGASGDLTLAVASGIVSMASTVLDFTTLGLTPGQWLFLGGDTAPTQFVNAANQGYARVLSVTAHLIVFDNVLFVPVADAGTAKTVQIFVSDVLRNELTPSLIVRRSYTLERTLGNDGVGIQSELVQGAIPDQLTLNIPAANKMTVDLTFAGMNYEALDGTAGQIASGTRVNVAAPGEGAYNTSENIYAIRLFVDNAASSTSTPLYAYVDDCKLVINNNVKGIKAVGTLGSFEASTGDFAVSATITAYFASVDSISSIIANASCGLNIIAAQNNYGMIWDVPLLTLGNGANKVEKDKAITVDLTSDGAMNPNGYTAMLCIFRYLPTAAM